MLTLHDLPKSALIVLEKLEKDGPMSPKQIASKAGLPSRTVSFALQKLVRQHLCVKIPNLNDMRRPLYQIDIERYKTLQQTIHRLRMETGLHRRAI